MNKIHNTAATLLLALATTACCGTTTTESHNHQQVEHAPVADAHHHHPHDEATTRAEAKSLPACLFAGNEEWAKEMVASDPQFFDKLAQGQDPNYLFIGCSDSRVPAAQILGLKAGELFVHRNIANVVCNNDANIEAVIEYAVSHLMVEHIIICGHTDCGGVKAALSPHDHGTLTGWLSDIRNTICDHRDELAKITNENEKVTRVVELNVMEQCHNLMKLRTVQLSWKKTGIPNIQGIIFDVATGKIRDLHISNETLYNDIKTTHDIE